MIDEDDDGVRGTLKMVCLNGKGEEDSTKQLRFDGRVAIVTGAGRGLGRAYALFLAERGAKIIVNDLGVAMDGSGQSAEPAETVVQEITRASGEAIANVDTVATEEGAASIVDTAIKAFGRVDIVVHNAGPVTFAPFGEMSYRQYRELVTTHADGGFLVCRAAWSHMARQRYGRIILISSQAALSGLPNQAHYVVAKTALTGLARALALEGSALGIRANALSVTGYTRMMAGFFRPDVPGRPQLASMAQAEQWWKRYVRPELVSSVVAYLAHELCELSGEIIDTGAGRVSRQFLAMSEGYANLQLTPEAVRDNLRKIVGVEGGYHTFADANSFLEWQYQKVLESGALSYDAMTGP
jgi:NAD(P)-dependent dehydrogenase (short-subunit alcohol dehydrogenase family)